MMAASGNQQVCVCVCVCVCAGMMASMQPGDMLVFGIIDMTSPAMQGAPYAQMQGGIMQPQYAKHDGPWCHVRHSHPARRAAGGDGYGRRFRRVVPS